MLPFFQTEQTADLAVVDFLTPSLMNATELERIGQALITLVDDGARRVLLDFTRVNYLSSQALGVVLNLNKRLAKESGGRLALCGVNAALMDLLRITRLNKVLKIGSDRAQAMDFIGA